MAGRPITRARIAAQVAAQGGVPLPPAKEQRRKPGRPKGSTNRAARVVSDLPPKPAAQIVDTVDASFGEALASAAAAAPGTDMNAIFEELRKECMRFSLEVMRMHLDPDERSFNKLLGVKQQITTAVLTATTRVRPGDLRERDDDGLGALLDKLKAGEGLTIAEPTPEDLLN